MISTARSRVMGSPARGSVRMRASRVIFEHFFGLQATNDGVTVIQTERCQTRTLKMLAWR
jgi:hypothetical protein